MRSSLITNKMWADRKMKEVVLEALEKEYGIDEVPETTMENICQDIVDNLYGNPNEARPKSFYQILEENYLIHCACGYLIDESACECKKTREAFGFISNEVCA